MSAYYNEIDPFAAQWLRELIRAELIPAGDVDERSIEDITPNEMRRYTQCHFFAGIGGWAYALDLAGWPRDRSVWTGSCPCQPFSAAGKGDGFADERHLWPAWQHLIAQCRPAVVLGEQVASKAGLAWFDLVSSDLEGSCYAVGAADLCSAGVTDTDIRQRLYWVADSCSEGLAQRIGDGRVQREAVGAQQGQTAIRGGDARGLGDAYGSRSQPWRITAEAAGHRGSSFSDGRLSWMGDAELSAQERQRQHGRKVVSVEEAARLGLPGRLGSLSRPVEWVACGDGKLRPIEPGTFPLAAGVPARVGRLRGYGNAINAEAAAAFIRAYLEASGVNSLQAAA